MHPVTGLGSIAAGGLGESADIAARLAPLVYTDQPFGLIVLASSL